MKLHINTCRIPTDVAVPADVLDAEQVQCAVPLRGISRHWHIGRFPSKVTIGLWLVLPSLHIAVSIRDNR